MSEWASEWTMNIEERHSEGKKYVSQARGVFVWRNRQKEKRDPPRQSRLVCAQNKHPALSSTVFSSRVVSAKKKKSVSHSLALALPIL